ncbi:MAG TPA: GntR family transcriptional regulator [Usitatibacter sp.]|nr:GntR family transcriptional regulator [Usitatibacter sp.]
MAELKSARPALSADAVAESLRRLILDGTLGIGLQLRQEELARRFGVSRIPVREALGRLQAEGLVEHFANRGSVVAARSVDDLLETLDIRIALETRAMKLALPNLTPRDYKAARSIMKRYDESESPRQWTELNLEFHLTLYRPCGRPRLVRMIEDLVRGISIHLRQHISNTVGRSNPQAEHQDILEACLAGDARRAVALTEQHIEHTKRSLLAAFPPPPGGGRGRTGS